MAIGWRIFHERRSDVYIVAQTLFRDEAMTDWFAYVSHETLSGELQEAPNHRDNRPHR
jgi:hypothetical protein